MTKEEMIEQLEEAQRLINEFYSKSANQLEATILGGIDIDTEDVAEADNCIGNVLYDLSKGYRND